MPSLATRLAWVDRGAEAFGRSCPTIYRHVLPPDIESIYVCPLCVTTTQFRGFFRRAVELRELTVEHAPPRHAGGRAIALTCAPCNHTAGYQLDAHASQSGTTAKRTMVPVRVHFRGNRLNMSLSADESGVRLFGEPKRNSPAAATAFFAELEAATEASSVASRRQSDQSVRPWYAARPQEEMMGMHRDRPARVGVRIHGTMVDAFRTDLRGLGSPRSGSRVAPVGGPRSRRCVASRWAPTRGAIAGSLRNGFGRRSRLFGTDVNERRNG